MFTSAGLPIPEHIGGGKGILIMIMIKFLHSK